MHSNWIKCCLIGQQAPFALIGWQVFYIESEFSPGSSISYSASALSSLIGQCIVLLYTSWTSCCPHPTFSPCPQHLGSCPVLPDRIQPGSDLIGRPSSLRAVLSDTSLPWSALSPARYSVLYCHPFLQARTLHLSNLSGWQFYWTALFLVTFGMKSPSKTVGNAA